MTGEDAKVFRKLFGHDPRNSGISSLAEGVVLDGGRTGERPPDSSMLNFAQEDMTTHWPRWTLDVSN